MTVPMTGRTARYTRVGVAVAVAAAAVVGTATTSSAATIASTLSPTSGAVGAVINVNAPVGSPNLFRAADGTTTLAHTGTLTTSKPTANSVLFAYNVTTCPTVTSGGFTPSATTTPIPISTRTVTDAAVVAHGTAGLSTATGGGWSHATVGMSVVAPTGIASTVTVTDVTDKQVPVLSAAPTADLTGQTVIIGNKVTDATISSSTALYSSSGWPDVVTGMTASGPGIPAGTTVTKTDANNLVLGAASTAGTGLTVYVGDKMTNAVIHSGLDYLTSATAKFTPLDTGKTVGVYTGASNAHVTTNIPASTTISSYVSATQVTLSSTTASAGTGIQATFGPQAGPYEASAISVVSGARLVVKAPTWVNATTNKYAVCVYDNNNSSGTPATVIASAATSTTQFQVSAAPVVTAVSPSSGPALGGNTVTVSATGLYAGATVTLGGLPITGTLVASTNTTPVGTFTAVMPSKPAGALHFQVTSTGGPSALGSPDQYTYADGITVTPTTMPASTATVLDIMGTGFSSLTFTDSGTLTDTNAHVFLVTGGPFVSYTGHLTDNLDKAECTNVTVLSDQELICVLDGTSTANTPGVVPTAGAYSVVLLRTGGAGGSAPGSSGANLARQTIITSTATFTIAPY